MKIILLCCLIPFAVLIPQDDDSWKIYSDSSLARVDITVDPAVLQWMYENTKSDSEHYAVVRFRNDWIDETEDSVGFRLRGNTSRDSKKKSFKISYNTFIKGRKFHGVEKLNLNGEHNDPSIIRSKLSFDLFRDMGITASRANHARVFINGVNYGLYVNVEHVDEEFVQKNFADDGGNLYKCLYPADLNYLGADPDLYKQVMHSSERAYELKTNEGADDYTGFARMVDLVNNTPDASLADSVESLLDIRRVLQYYAMNTLLGSWDDYRSLMNNYYLYDDPATGKFTLIPYDYDNTFGIDWFDVDWSAADPYAYPKAVTGARPLWDRIIANAQYRDLYTHFLRFARDRVTALPFWEERLQRLKTMITAAAEEDSFRTLDYGFTMDDFHSSYTSLSFNKFHVKTGLRQFVNQRHSTISAQLVSANAPPIVYYWNIQPSRPGPTDSIVVSAACFGASGVKGVLLHYTPAGAGTSTEIPMIFAGVPETQQVEEADRWIAVLPPLNGTASASVRISILDSLDQSVLYPRSGSIRITVSASSSASLVINEFMADNSTIADPAGDFDDWVEVYNPTQDTLTLTNKYITDKSSSLTKWKFTQPNLTIAPGDYLLVWCDEEPTEPGVHAGIKLSAGGEFIALTDSDGVTILDSLSFGPQTADVSFGRYPDGASTWGPMSPSPQSANTLITGVAFNPLLPDRFTVDVFPNPFNPSVTIQYTHAGEGTVRLEIFDLLGRLLWQFSEEQRQGGSRSVQWNGQTSAGSSAGSGVYLLRVTHRNAVSLKKLLLVK